MNESPIEKRNALSLKSLNQITTRGDGHLEKGEPFKKDDIDFSAASHLNIHQEGTVAGSQFNGNIFPSQETVITVIKENLPADMYYDQFGRCEVTLEFSVNEAIGWTGVKSIEELQAINPQITIEKSARMPGGVPGELNGVDGVWYPEMIRDKETGRFIVAKNEDGTVKNQKAKFEPLANVSIIPENSLKDTLETRKITVIIQKDRETQKPSVLTLFPGDNAPAFPAKIDTESYKTDTLSSESQESKFWENHVFLKQ